MTVQKSNNNKINNFIDDLGSILSTALSIPGLRSQSLSKWQMDCRRISQQLRDEMVRVAVVGAIKSGKSTFTNAMFNGDFLKRGAGVVTTMVTRIQSGPTLTAKLHFKSWAEINAEIDDALVLFPSRTWRSQTEQFDLQRPSDRAELQEALASLNAERLITNDTRNANSVLLSSYLKGFLRASAFIQRSSGELVFDQDRFYDHQNFVGDDSLSVYLKDIELQIAGGYISEHVEIADCQGSDSPNPLHLAMIQDYLIKTHLVIYLISSRSGLRQADIRFLSMLKKMAMDGYLMFVINCDLNEHSDLSDLQTVVERVREELALLFENPQIFCFSSLYHLFSRQPKALSQKDHARLMHWQKEPAMVDFSQSGLEQFQDSFNHRVTAERYNLLMQSHLGRLAAIAANLANWFRLHIDFQHRDADHAAQLTAQLTSHRRQMEQVGINIKTTLDGAVRKLKAELKIKLDRFFDNRRDRLVGHVQEFIANYQFSHDQATRRLQDSGFNQTLYTIFQQFKQDLDSFMAEKVNPEIVRWVKTIETQIIDYFATITAPYTVMIKDTLTQYAEEMQHLGIKMETSPGQDRISLRMDQIRRRAGVELPPARATMAYGAHIRTEAILRLSVGRFVGWIQKLFHKSVPEAPAHDASALQIGLRRIKSETAKSILSLFKDYRENLKFQYLLRLIDATAGIVYEQLSDRFESYGADVAHLAIRLGEKRDNRSDLSDQLANLLTAAGKVADELDQTRREMVVDANSESRLP